MDPDVGFWLGGAIIIAISFGIFWLLEKLFGWLWVLAHEGPLWARILLWPYKILMTFLCIYSAASLTRKAYRLMNKPE